MGEGVPTQEELVARVRGALESDGWEILSSEQHTSFVIKIDHELSAPMDIVFPTVADYSYLHIDLVLRKREFEIIRRRPSYTPHARLLQSLRLASLSRKWSQEGLTLVGDVLLSNDLLTREEVDWLDLAWMPWSDGSEQPLTSAGSATPTVLAPPSTTTMPT